MHFYNLTLYGNTRFMSTNGQLDKWYCYYTLAVILICVTRT